MADRFWQQASDAPSTTLLVQAILNIAYENEDYAFVLESLTVLSKKHGQFKTAVTATVDLVMGWLDNIKSREGIKVWLEWVAAVRSVTEGKVRHKFVDCDWIFSYHWFKRSS